MEENKTKKFEYDPSRPIFTSSNIVLIKKEENLKDFINHLNQYCASLQDEDYKEIVGDDIMWVARKYVNTHDVLDIKTVKDVLYYASSLNLLNTFVKQKVEGKRNKIISYYFKSFVLDRLVMAIVENKINDVIFDIAKDGHMSICYIKIYDMIFSFHEVHIPEETKNLILSSSRHQEITFDNVRKQKVAVTLYKNVFNY